MFLVYEIIIHNILLLGEENSSCTCKKSHTEKCECVAKRKRNRETEPNSEEQCGEVENNQQCKKPVGSFAVI